MICHHFRMFTARAWNLTSGFDENITNAVDYDMYLKLSEVGPFKHINKICYNRVLHGENTSIKKLKQQKENHFKVVNEALNRQKIQNIEYKSLSDEDACRRYTFVNNTRNKTLNNKCKFSAVVNCFNEQLTIGLNLMILKLRDYHGAGHMIIIFGGEDMRSFKCF